MASNSELRARARAQLDGNIFSSAWLGALLAILLYGLISAATASVVIGLILIGPLTFGVSRYMIRLARGNKDVQISEIFCGFSESFGSSFVLCLMQTIFLILWSMLLFIPGLIKSYSYSMAFYIQQDAPNKDWNDCITESRKMMNGHKWKLFCLDFSFLGWYIVGMLCCGVGVFWVDPYHELARANFYEELKAQQVQAF